MATIAEQLISLANTKAAIKQSIINKGVSVADTDPFSAYPAKIGQISSGGSASDEWQPNPNWWDIKKILDEDTRDYPGKVGVILYNFNDVSDFTLSSSGMTAVATSDGAFYSYADNGYSVSHNWDTTQDKDDGRGFKTRWVIYYYTTDTTSDSFMEASKNFGWEYNYIAYLVLRINLEGYYFCASHRFLEAIDNAGYSISGTNFYRFCSGCYSLQKLPDGLDTSNGTNFEEFCNGCNFLTKLPDGLDTSNGTNFKDFCSDCYSLQKLPDGLDISNGTNFNRFCNSCFSLTKLPDGLDTSNGTNFQSFCFNCRSLTKLPDGLDTSNGTNFTSFYGNCSSLQKTSEITMAANTQNYTYVSPFSGARWLKTIYLTLPSNTNFWLSMSSRISIESFRYIADHAPDVTATPLTLTIGSDNIKRCNEADPTIITNLNAKGWNVQ